MKWKVLRAQNDPRFREIFSKNFGAKNFDLSNHVFAIAGPCGGKTTGQTRLCTFFENMGWKVGRTL